MSGTSVNRGTKRLTIRLVELVEIAVVLYRVSVQNFASKARQGKGGISEGRGESEQAVHINLQVHYTLQHCHREKDSDERLVERGVFGENALTRFDGR